MPSEEWVCPMLGLYPDAFNHDTEEFSAIAATLMRHNAISDALSTTESFEPHYARTPGGEIDARPWCMGFYAIMQLRLLDWSQLLAASAPEDSPLRPILLYCTDETGKPVLYADLQHAVAKSARELWRDIPATVETIRQFWMPIRFKRRHHWPALARENDRFAKRFCLLVRGQSRSSVELPLSRANHLPSWLKSIVKKIGGIAIGRRQPRLVGREGERRQRQLIVGADGGEPPRIALRVLQGQIEQVANSQGIAYDKR